MSKVSLTYLCLSGKLSRYCSRAAWILITVVCLLEIEADKAKATLSDRGRHWIDASAILVSQAASDLHEDGEVKELIRKAHAYEENGDYVRAAKNWEVILTIRENKLGKEHPKTAEGLHNLGLLYDQLGRHQDAEHLLERALVIREEFFGVEHPITAESYNYLAVNMSLQGRYLQAEKLYKRAIDIREKVLGLEHIDVAESYNDLAVNMSRYGRYQKAELFYIRALKLREKLLGLDHPLTASSVSGLAVVMRKQGRYEEAERLYKRSLAIRERKLGLNHPDTARTINNLAVLYSKMSAYKLAESYHQKALLIRQDVLGVDHPYTANTLNNLGWLYDKQGRYKQAEIIHLKALSIKQKALDSDHPLIATSMSNLAESLKNQRAYKRAEDLFLAALLIREKALGSEHPKTIITLDKLIRLYLLKGQYDYARTYLTRLNRSQAKWLRRELPLQPRGLRMAQMAAQPDAIATTFALLDRDPASAELALEARLNRQGLLAEIEQRQRLLADSSPQNKDLAQRIVGLDRQLATQTKITSGQREQLVKQRQMLEAELNRQLPNLVMKPVTTDQVANALKVVAPDGLLVEFQKYRVYQGHQQGNKQWGKERYLALLLQPDGQIHTLQLGEAAVIDSAVDLALKSTFMNASDAAERWIKVSDLVLKPLEPYLSNVRQLFLTPDGVLHRVPFAMLQVSGGAQPLLLNEAFKLRILTTGRDLLNLQKPGVVGRGSIVMADPNYESKGRSTTTTTTTTTTLSRTRGMGQRQHRSGELSANKVWMPLPATAKEAVSLAQLLNIQEPIMGNQATASFALKQISPRIFHIATHGFFQPNQVAGSRHQEDPMLRSGLVLAGANYPDADPNDDGYLTAAEVTGMNLEGTELVTLSACQTGLGDLHTGEGVYGLQRALTVAGSRSTLLSLWSVDDEGTKAFMVSYYQRLMDGEGRADALAATQKEFRQHPIAGWRNPYIWAAFQLVGDWREIDF